MTAIANKWFKSFALLTGAGSSPILNQTLRHQRMRDSIYIKILEYGEQCGIDGASHDCLLDWLEQEGVLENKDNIDLVIKNRITSIFYECFEETMGSEHNTRLLKPEYFYRLIEFRELEESRKASSDANKKSNTAITISIVALVVTVVISFIQLTSNITIRPSQIEALVNSNSAPTQQRIVIDDSQLKVITSSIQESTKTTNETLRFIEGRVIESLNKSMQPTANASVD